MPHADLSKPEQSMTAGRIAGILYRTNFLEAVERDTAIALIKNGISIIAEPGEVVGRHGDGPDFVLVLLEGAFVIRSGKRVIGRMDRRGDVIGELGVLGFDQAVTEIVAETRVEAFAITTDALGQEEFAVPAAKLYQALSYSLANCIRALSVNFSGRIDRRPQGSGIDSRTGLANTDRLLDILNALATARNGLPFSVAVARIPQATVLDDEKMALLGDALRSNIRHDDLAARLDDTHFAVLLPNCNGFNARNVATGLNGAVHRIVGDDAPIAFSVATHDGKEDAAGMLERARLAVEQAEGSVISAD